jgi:hypothetical protein
MADVIAASADGTPKKSTLKLTVKRAARRR